MQESDWDLYWERLVEQTKLAIQQFAKEHGDEEVCYFAYDSEPCYGFVLTCFNVAVIARVHAQTARVSHAVSPQADGRACLV
jgi:hypothetical protein